MPPGGRWGPDRNPVSQSAETVAFLVLPPCLRPRQSCVKAGASGGPLQRLSKKRLEGFCGAEPGKAKNYKLWTGRTGHTVRGGHGRNGEVDDVTRHQPHCMITDASRIKELVSLLELKLN